MEEIAQFKFAPSTQEVAFATLLARTSDPERSWLEAGFEDCGSTKNIKKALSLAKKEKIQERLDYEKQLVVQKSNVSSADVITETSNIAFSNIKDFLDENDEFIPLHTLPRSVTAAVQSLKRTETEYGVVTEIKLVPKTPALKMFVEMHNLNERHTQANAPKIVLNLGSQKAIEQ
jgi:hypothetical protein